MRTVAPLRRRPRQVKRRPEVLIVVLGLVGFGIQAVIGWPGWMSADSIAQWAQAKSGAITDWYPPMMTWSWSLLRPETHGPLIPFLLQLELFWMGVTLAALALQPGPRWTRFLPLLMLLNPAAWGLLVVSAQAAVLSLLTLAFGVAALAVRAYRAGRLTGARVALWLAAVVAGAAVAGHRHMLLVSVLLVVVLCAALLPRPLGRRARLEIGAKAVILTVATGVLFAVSAPAVVIGDVVGTRVDESSFALDAYHVDCAAVWSTGTLAAEPVSAARPLAHASGAVRQGRPGHVWRGMDRLQRPRRRAGAVDGCVAGHRRGAPGHSGRWPGAASGRAPRRGSPRRAGCRRRGVGGGGRRRWIRRDRWTAQPRRRPPRDRCGRHIVHPRPAVLVDLPDPGGGRRVGLAEVPGRGPPGGAVAGPAVPLRPGRCARADRPHRRDERAGAGCRPGLARRPVGRRVQRAPYPVLCCLGHCRGSAGTSLPGGDGTGCQEAAGPGRRRDPGSPGAAAPDPRAGAPDPGAACPGSPCGCPGFRGACARRQERVSRRSTAPTVPPSPDLGPAPLTAFLAAQEAQQQPIDLREEPEPAKDSATADTAG